MSNYSERVGLFAGFDELQVAVEIVASGNAGHQIEALIGAPPSRMLRLPSFELTSLVEYSVIDQVCVTLTAGTQADLLGVDLHCGLTTRSYVTRARQFRWDFLTLLRAVITAHQLSVGNVAFHAASLKVGDHAHLLLGESGTGKSLTCAAAFGEGITVLTSELTFVGEMQVHVGNHVMEVSDSARRAYGLPPLGTVATCAKKDTDMRELGKGPHAAPITGISVIRVEPGPIRTATIKPLRARTLLFENAMRQHPITSLIAEQGVPLLDGISPSHLSAIIGESVMLSTLPVQVVVGPPTEIIQQLISAEP